VPSLEIKNVKELLEVLKVLANPTRLRIIALLSERPMYVSEIARELRMPYPLVHLYLTKLEEIGMVETRYEFIKSEKPHVRKYCELKDFKIVISPEIIKKLFYGDEDGES